MQIHELNTFTGTPGGGDFLAIDSGFDTAKISADKLLAETMNKPENEGEPGQLLRNKGNGQTEWSDIGLPTDDQTAEAISKWLQDHPEATTTVQDGSLTLPKFKPGELPFVTPEQYGAIGDGVTDDTAAWQAAVDSGYNVRATAKAYKCGQINVTRNIAIDCNNASFECTESKLFNCEGTVVATLTGEADYTANQTGYVITDDQYSGYTGVAMLKGSNNFEASRPYYRGGFVCEFHVGYMTTSFPIDVTDVTIEIIDPIKVHISNVGDIKQTISTNDCSISIKYGFGCTIRDSNIQHSGAYVVILLDSCLNCIVDNCNIMQSYTSSDNNSYLVSFSNSSFCSVINSYMFNKNWHCITTGDTYLCYHNMVDKCHLYTYGSVACEDHENALNTIVTNSVVAGIGLSGMGVVDNCDIVSNMLSPFNCLIRVLLMSNADTAVYNISNVRFMPKTGTNSNYIGVWVQASVRNMSATYYLKRLNLTNVKNCNKSTQAEFRFSLNSSSLVVIYDVSITNCNCYYYLATTAGSNTDISKYTLAINDCNNFGYDDQYFPSMGGGSYIFNDVILTNVKLHSLAGRFHNLHLNGFWCRGGISTPTVTNELFGSLVNSVISASVIVGAAAVKISDMADGTGRFFNIASYGTTGKKFWSYYDQNGAVQTAQITA